MRYLLFALIVAMGLADAGSARAAWTIAPPGTTRSKEIKAMDIHDRPNRPLHVYGDVVRVANRKR